MSSTVLTAREISRTVAFVCHDVDPMRLVSKACFLKHDADLHPFWRRRGNELQSVRMLCWPALEDWMVERHFILSFQARRHMRAPQCSECVLFLLFFVFLLCVL